MEKDIVVAFRRSQQERNYSNCFLKELAGVDKTFVGAHLLAIVDTQIGMLL